MSNKNTKCLMCGYAFHWCTSCGCDGSMEYGYCSDECRDSDPSFVPLEDDDEDENE